MSGHQRRLGGPEGHARDRLSLEHSHGGARPPLGRATIAACRAAFREGIAANIAGGTHHAYADKGGGFCVFNDAAVAARLMQAEHARGSRTSLQVAIVDLDVHQGNGTARIFRDDPSVFTLSLHGQKNFPVPQGGQ